MLGLLPKMPRELVRKKKACEAPSRLSRQYRELSLSLPALVHLGSLLDPASRARMGMDLTGYNR
jgi:hypothetical protein